MSTSRINIRASLFAEHISVRQLSLDVQSRCSVMYVRMYVIPYRLEIPIKVPRYLVRAFTVEMCMFNHMHMRQLPSSKYSVILVIVLLV